MRSPPLPPSRVLPPNPGPDPSNPEVLSQQPEFSEPNSAPQRSRTMPRRLSPERSEPPSLFARSSQSTMIPRLEMLPENRFPSHGPAAAILHQDNTLSTSMHLRQDETRTQSETLSRPPSLFSSNREQAVRHGLLPNSMATPAAPPPSDNTRVSTLPSLYAFLDNNLLPLMPSHSLYPYSPKTCGICHEIFHSTHVPVLIVKTQGCSGHIFGYQCLRRSISADTANSNKCPLCRTTWFQSSRLQLTRLALLWGQIERVETKIVEDIERTEAEAEAARTAALEARAATLEAGVTTPEAEATTLEAEATTPETAASTLEPEATVSVADETRPALDGRESVDSLSNQATEMLPPSDRALEMLDFLTNARATELSMLSEHARFVETSRARDAETEAMFASFRAAQERGTRGTSALRVLKVFFFINIFFALIAVSMLVPRYGLIPALRGFLIETLDWEDEVDWWTRRFMKG